MFRPVGRRLLGEQNRRAAAASGVFRRYDDPLALDAIEDFFREVYWSESAGAQDGLDKKEILARLEERKGDLLFPFEAIARDFRLIEDGMLPILIPFDDDARRSEGLETTERVGEVARRSALRCPGAARAARAPLRRGRGAASDPAPVRRAVLRARRASVSAGRGADVERPDLRGAEENVI